MDQESSIQYDLKKIEFYMLAWKRKQMIQRAYSRETGMAQSIEATAGWVSNNKINLKYGIKRPIVSIDKDTMILSSMDHGLFLSRYRDIPYNN